MALRAWPTAYSNVSVSALGANQRYLYVGLGPPRTTDTEFEHDVAELWRYDGKYFVRVSAPHTLGAGVQTLLVRKGTQPDCDGDGESDAYEIATDATDCDHNGVPDSCDPDRDGDITGCTCLGKPIPDSPAR